MPNCPNCGKPYKPGDEVCPNCGYVFPFTTDILATGTVLQGRYEIQQLSHTGGMGYVYLAKDKKLYDRLCIVKQVKEPVKSDSDLKKLEEEAMRMAKLSHPNVAMVLDHFVENGYYFLVVERISGKTLSEVFEQRHGQLKEEEVVNWAISMCDVISYIHKEGVIHRDISPDNVMVTEEGLIKFVDFGTLREMRYITTKGTAGMGKYGYTPPEQWQGKPTPQSDIFALGATIYYLLTGSLPLSKEYLTGQGPQRDDFSPSFPPIRTKNPDISAQLEAVLNKALQLDIGSRYSSAIEFGQALRNLGEIAIIRKEPGEEAIGQSEVVSLSGHLIQDIKPLSASTQKPISHWNMILRFAIFGTLLLAGVAFGFFQFSGAHESDFNTFIKQTKNGQVDTIKQMGNTIIGLKGDKEIVRTTFIGSTEELIKTLETFIGLEIITLNVDEKTSVLRIRVPPSYAVLPDSSLRIAFASNRDNFSYIHIMNADGSNQIRIADISSRIPYFDVYRSRLAWSPDGTRIAFYREDAIWFMNADGSNQVRIAKDCYSPAWSPDGKKIAFVSKRDGEEEIYVMDSNGSNQVRLTRNSGFDNCPAWSPDGKKIAFTSFRSSYIHVCIMDPDGSNQVILTKGGEPAWSPDGKRIAFVSYDDKHGSIHIMNADGSNRIRLTYGGDYAPAWSPDGKKIAFHSNKDGNWDIYIMNADGTNRFRLTDHPDEDLSPTWSPR